MPTRNVNLTDELDGFVLAKVESGRYENAPLSGLWSATNESMRRNCRTEGRDR